MKSLLTFAIVGTALAATPPGFEPSSSRDLQVAFCDNLAVNGANIPQDETEMSPAVGTTEQLTGSYAIILIDTDMPPSTPGGENGTFLHLIQTGLTSSNVTANIAGQEMFELENKDNVEPFATFIQPDPPNTAPTTHRYTTLLLNTTGNNQAISVLQSAGRTRSNFNVTEVVQSSGAIIVAGGWFNVTNAAATEKVEIRNPIDEEEAAKKMHMNRRNSMVLTTMINHGPAPTPVPTPTGPLFTLTNTTLARGQPQTIIIIRLSGTGTSQNRTSIISFTTPKVVTEGPATPSAGFESPAAGVTSGAPFQNQTTTPVPEDGVPTTETSALPATTTGVPLPTGGAVSLGTRGRVLMTGLSVLVAAFVGF